MQLGLALAAVYLVAAIPFGLLLGRARGTDVRRQGSGNIGATNVLRTQGMLPGIATLLLDAAKGAGGVLAVAAMIPDPEWAPIAAAPVAVIGHCYPVYLRFKGGKGVATAAGAFLALSPGATLAMMVIVVIVIAWSRMVSAGSVVGAAVFPVMAWGLAGPEVALGAIPASAVILWRHRENLQRILDGTEGRLGGSGAARRSR